jgi:hypothetical protein
VLKENEPSPLCTTPFCSITPSTTNARPHSAVPRLPKPSRLHPLPAAIRASLAGGRWPAHQGPSSHFARRRLQLRRAHPHRESRSLSLLSHALGQCDAIAGLGVYGEKFECTWICNLTILNYLFGRSYYFRTSYLWMNLPKLSLSYRHYMLPRPRLMKAPRVPATAAVHVFGFPFTEADLSTQPSSYRSLSCTLLEGFCSAL